MGQNRLKRMVRRNRTGIIKGFYECNYSLNEKLPKKILVALSTNNHNLGIHMVTVCTPKEDCVLGTFYYGNAAIILMPFKQTKDDYFSKSGEFILKMGSFGRTPKKELKNI